jgi:kumamolisin
MATPFAKSHVSRIKRPRVDMLISSFTAAQLAKKYGYPQVNSAPNIWVAIGELGGGYSLADLQKYCSSQGFPTPPVAEISVRGATNSYTGDSNGADMEVALDMQNIAGATGGKVGLLMIWAPNDSEGIADATMTAAQDGRASAMSWSWGQDEAGWGGAAGMQTTEAAAAACLAKGISVFAASGDDGSSDQGAGNNVDYPASSPNVFGCGGTSLLGGSETAWSYGGGGISAVFSRPTWQVIPAGVDPSNHRCVPDLACDADPNSGYSVFIGGKSYVIGGTSAVAPMLAAGKALCDAVAGKRLTITPAILYLLKDLTDITQGSNGAYKAAIGYDLCTGMGVPNATFWQALMQGATPPAPPSPPSPPVPPPPVPPTTAEFDEMRLYKGGVQKADYALTVKP